MTELHRTSIDGIPTVWTQRPGPLRAGLLFRTGRADETLVTAGRTHLIEHLALSTLGEEHRNYNGFVGATATGFTAMGSPDEVVATLARICAGLAALPADHLVTEKQILSAEAEHRSYDMIGNMLGWRFGATGYGLPGMRELGVATATIEELQERAGQVFTAGNAVLWLSGPPPAGLALELPAGSRQAMPPLVPTAITFPRWYVENHSGGVASSSIVPRVAASSVFQAIASKRLGDVMRTQLAMSYSPHVIYDPLTAGAAHLVLFADSKEDARRELTEHFHELFDGFARVSAEELAWAQETLARHWSGTMAPSPDDIALGEVRRAAMDSLVGKEFETAEQIAAEAAQVTVDDVAQFVAQMQQTAMFAVPGTATIKPWMGVNAQRSEGRPVVGKTLVGADAPVVREKLVVGADGVSLLFANGSNKTVRFAELAAALSFDDGGIVLVGRDGLSVTVEPTLWRRASKIGREIRARVAPQLLVDRGPREANQVPKPTVSLWRKVVGYRRWLWWALVIAFVGYAIFEEASSVASGNTDASSAVGNLVVLAMLFAVGSGVGRLVRAARRKLRRRG